MSCKNTTQLTDVTFQNVMEIWDPSIVKWSSVKMHIHTIQILYKSLKNLKSKLGLEGMEVANCKRLYRLMQCV